MARTEIQITLRGRSIGLSKDGYLVVNHPNKTQVVVSPTGIQYTDAAGTTTTVGGGGGGTWGSITGTLSGQTDLQTAIDAKLDLLQVEGTVVAAATTNLGTSPKLAQTVSGNTGITSFGSVTAGTIRKVTFTGSPLITHNGTSLILPNSQNIQAKPGDSATLLSLGSGNWRVYSFIPFYAPGQVVQTADITSGRAFTAADFLSSRGGILQINSGSVLAFTMPTVASMSLAGSGNILMLKVKGAGIPTVAGATSSTTVNGVVGTSTVNPAGGAAVQYGTYIIEQVGTSDVWYYG